MSRKHRVKGASEQNARLVKPHKGGLPTDQGLAICQKDIDAGLSDEQITWLVGHLNWTPLLEVVYRSGQEVS